MKQTILFFICILVIFISIFLLGKLYKRHSSEEYSVQIQPQEEIGNCPSSSCGRAATISNDMITKQSENKNDDASSVGGMGYRLQERRDNGDGTYSIVYRDVYG